MQTECFWLMWTEAEISYDFDVLTKIDSIITWKNLESDSSSKPQGRSASDEAYL